MKKPDYAALFTQRADGRYMGYDTSGGKRRAVYDRDPERLWHRLNDPKPPTVVTFRQVADAWERQHVEMVSFKTAESYAAPLRRLCEHFGDADVTGITATELSDYIRALGSRGYARRTVQLHRDILNMIFAHAVLDPAIPLTVNPCGVVALPKNLKVTKRPLPADDAIEAVKAGGGEPFGLFALICLYAGLRRGEALALRYEDIDRKNKLIRVTKSVEYLGNSPHIKPPKSEAGTREVPLLDPLAAAIPKGAGYIFTDRDGKLLSKTVYRTRWLQYCAAIGHQITAHQLRHGYATILYEAGIGDKDAQELLGHANITTTRDVYTHIRQAHRAETVKKLNDYLAKTAD